MMHNTIQNYSVDYKANINRNGYQCHALFHAPCGSTDIYAQTYVRDHISQ